MRHSKSEIFNINFRHPTLQMKTQSTKNLPESEHWTSPTFRPRVPSRVVQARKKFALRVPQQKKSSTGSNSFDSAKDYFVIRKDNPLSRKIFAAQMSGHLEAEMRYAAAPLLPEKPRSGSLGVADAGNLSFNCFWQ